MTQKFWDYYNLDYETELRSYGAEWYQFWWNRHIKIRLILLHFINLPITFRFLCFKFKIFGCHQMWCGFFLYLDEYARQKVTSVIISHIVRSTAYPWALTICQAYQGSLQITNVDSRTATNLFSCLRAVDSRFIGILTVTCSLNYFFNLVLTFGVLKVKNHSLFLIYSIIW